MDDVTYVRDVEFCM